MNALYILIAITAGILLPFQAGANAEIGKRLGHPIHGVTYNFISGLVILGIVTLIFARQRAPIGSLASTPLWSWIGGFCGVAYVLMALTLSPKIGSLNVLICVLVGQMAAALLVDHFGLVGLPIKGVSTSRLIGCAIVMLGMVVANWSEIQRLIAPGASDQLTPVRQASQ